MLTVAWNWWLADILWYGGSHERDDRCTGGSTLACAGKQAHRSRRMIPQANITVRRANAWWPDDAQVEQDLVLTLALIGLFSGPELAGKIGLRSGTATPRQN